MLHSPDVPGFNPILTSRLQRFPFVWDHPVIPLRPSGPRFARSEGVLCRFACTAGYGVGLRSTSDVASLTRPTRCVVAEDTSDQDDRVIRAGSIAYVGPSSDADM
jgi:hypothetical protein